MGKIKLSDTVYAVCPEGDHIFYIKDVEHDAAFGTVIVKMRTADGYTDTERYQLTDGKGNINDGALGAFSYLTKCAMNDLTLSEIDPLQIKGHYVKATVTHDIKESTKTKGKMITFTSISNIEAATEAQYNASATTANVAQTIAAPAEPAAKPATSGVFDLDAILGAARK